MPEQPDNRPPLEQESSQAAGNRATERLGVFVGGCLGLIFLIWTLTMIVCAVIGLATGYLYVPPARSGTPIELHGMWARIVSAGLLLFAGVLIYVLYRNSRGRRKPKILED